MIVFAALMVCFGVFLNMNHVLPAFHSDPPKLLGYYALNLGLGVGGGVMAIVIAVYAFHVFPRIHEKNTKAKLLVLMSARGSLGIILAGFGCAMMMCTKANSAIYDDSWRCDPPMSSAQSGLPELMHKVQSGDINIVGGADQESAFYNFLQHMNWNMMYGEVVNHHFLFGNNGISNDMLYIFIGPSSQYCTNDQLVAEYISEYGSDRP